MNLRLQFVDEVGDAGGTRNEDLAGYSEQSAWVFDGATSLNESEVGPAWLVQTAAPRLQHHLSRSPRVSLRHAVACTIQEIADLEAGQRLPAGQAMASASLTLCRLSGSMLEYFSLGDATLVVQGPRSIVVVDDPPSTQREQAYVGEGEAGVLERLNQRRLTAMNRDGGFWIFSDDPRAAGHGHVGQASVQPGDVVLLASDGFARLVDLFSEFASWRALLEEALDGGLKPLLERLRLREDEDADRRRYPRVKSRDDATALLLRVRVEHESAG